MMIRAYRMRGHLHANLDPLGIAKPFEDYNELSPTAYGFTEADYDRKIFIDNVLGLEYATIREMLEILKRTYCSTLGVEFMHISDPEEKAWIQERIEGPDKGIAFTPNGKKAILHKLIEAEGFEQFIDVKYKGTKRFGLDGGESLIPALEQIIKRGGALGLKEIVLGMAHRGRLNVLSQGDGQAAPRHVPRVQGRLLRARRRRRFGRREVPPRRLVGPRVRRQQGAPVADRQPVAPRDRRSGGHGQGPRQAGPASAASARKSCRATSAPRSCRCCCTATRPSPARACRRILGLSGLRGHRVGGTVHFIINNQIGFTTNPASRARRPIRPTSPR
jgi:2-oxoglutarate dehydrogenase E1 component